MKKIGEYTLRGSIDEEDAATNPHTITLFDGRFDTGYRVVKFEIANNGGTTTDVSAVLATEPGLTPIGDWNFGDQREIGWARYHNWDYNLFNQISSLDPDNLVIEDLYVYGTNSYRVNYLIVMEKYEFSDWNGALAMVRNRAQGSSEA